MSELRVAHIADSHLDEAHRLEDNVKVHDAFIEDAHEADVDVILHGGDFFDRRSTPISRNALEHFLTGCSSVAPTVGAKGNHDVEEDLSIYNRLLTGNRLQIYERPTSINAGFRDEKFGVVALPWFSKAHIAASLPADTPASETTERTIDAARQLLQSMRFQAEEIAREGRVPLFVGHLQVAGSETSTGQTLIGTTVELAPAEILEIGCAYAALGHIHKAQSWHDGRVAYSGSPQRMNYGEPEPKGWNLVTIDTERWLEPGGVKVEFMALPAREIVLLEVDMSQPGILDEAATPAFPQFNGALVRYRYRIRPQDLHLVNEDEIERRFLSSGAHEVKLEAILVHEDRVRCAEIATAANTWDKLLAYWLAKSIDVDEAARVRVKAKLEQMEVKA